MVAGAERLGRGRGYSRTVNVQRALTFLTALRIATVGPVAATPRVGGAILTRIDVRRIRPGAVGTSGVHIGAARICVGRLRTRLCFDWPGRIGHGAVKRLDTRPHLLAGAGAGRPSAATPGVGRAGRRAAAADTKGSRAQHGQKRDGQENSESA